MAQTNETKTDTQSSQLVLTMKVFKQCKHSVRYNPIGDEEPGVPMILQSLYLSREGYDDLGQPERIRVEIASRRDKDLFVYAENKDPIAHL